MSTAPPAERPVHLVASMAVETPNLGGRGDGLDVRTVDLSVASTDDLLAIDAPALVTLVAPGWSHLRAMALPAALLGRTTDVLIKLVSETSRGFSRTSIGALTMRGATVEWRPTGDGVDIAVQLPKPMPVLGILRAVCGDVGSAPRVPLRAAIAHRSVEPFVVGNPHVRYHGVNDVVTSLDLQLQAVDMVIDAATELSDCGAAPAVDQLPHVRVLDESSPRPLSRTDLAGVDPRLVLPPVDTAVVNPMGFEPHPKRGAARLVPAPHAPETLRIVDPRGDDVVAVRRGAPLSRRDQNELRRFSQVEIDLAAHDDAWALARLMSQLAVAGVPLRCDALSGALPDLLGGPVSDELRWLAATAIDEPVAREAASVRLRRAALRQFSPEATARCLAATARLAVPPPPLVSVLLVTRRPAFVESAIAQIARQTWPRLEVVLGLHGEDFDPYEIGRITDAAPFDVHTVEVPSSVAFGDALNRATAASGGAYITKWDDDDLYGAEHVWDLMAAAEYSGAALVGKGSDITMLADLGVTVRRPSRGAERRVRGVAGGTFLLRRHVLEDIGGWRPLPFSVDRAVLLQLNASGALIYRTHQFGYVLRRHGQGHTWDPGVQYFLDEAEEQWPSDSARQRLVIETDLGA